MKTDSLQEQPSNKPKLRVNWIIPRLFVWLTIHIVAWPVAHASTNLYPEGAGPYMLRAQAYAVRSNWDGVITECDDAIRLYPETFAAYLGRAVAYKRKGDFNQVISNYSEIIRLDPSYLNAYSERAFAYSRVGSLDEAIDDYAKVIVLNSKLASWAYRQRAIAYGMTREYAQALRDATECIRLSSTNAEAFWIRGRLHAIQQDFGKAATDLVKAIELESKNIIYANALAWLLATCPEASHRNGGKAVELAQKACESTKWEDGASLDTLAAAYAESGDFAKAVSYQTMALARAKDEKDERKLRLELYEKDMPYREGRWKDFPNR